MHMVHSREEADQGQGVRRGKKEREIKVIDRGWAATADVRMPSERP